VLPVIVGVIGGIGTGTRLYRTFFLEEVNRDYVRTARAKGLRERGAVSSCAAQRADPDPDRRRRGAAAVVHGGADHRVLLRRAGLGSYTIDAINRQDFAIVRAMVFLGSVLYILGLILTDISYTMVDPRVRLS
jgi:peptide/nickel transport system permease protein